jgi:DNA-binding CsgD family transcriptional regulator
MSGVALTDLQQHMLRELVKGKRLNEIALQRGISPQGMNAMANFVRMKIGLRTQFQLGAWAERHGYGEPSEGRG